MGPVMQNPDNQAGWTDLVTKDLMERFNNFVAQNYVMIGLSKGRTLLPLPNKKLRFLSPASTTVIIKKISFHTNHQAFAPLLYILHRKFCC